MVQQQVDGGQRLVGAAIGDVQGPQGMVFREAMFERLDEAGRGDRAGDEGGADRFEGARRQSLRRQARPEAVAVAETVMKPVMPRSLIAS